MARDLHQIPPGDTDELPEPPRLRLLRRLVTLLTATMILAMLVIAGALVYSVIQPGSRSAAPHTADEIPLVQGFEVISVSRAGDRLYLLLQNTETGLRTIEERDASDRRLIGRYRLTPEEAN